MSTVAAISTPDGVGGISVIRISGREAIAVAAKVFRGKISPEQMESHTCCYGKIIKDGKIIDDGVLTVFREPNSYTGENVAEISCHGGRFVTRQALRAVIQAGAEPAGAGEFTKRAFLNGKMSLTQAEAVMDVISAQGEQALNSAANIREGKLFRKVKEVSDGIVKLAASLDAWVDYPEEDLPEAEPEQLMFHVEHFVGSLEKLLEGYDKGRILRQGIDTVILGKTNVGKSTLMNCLVGYDRSIVTDVKGTTRDIVEESVRLGGLTLRLSDTAGLRETSDPVEKLGIDLARKKAENAQLIIAVLDGSQELDGQDREILELIRGRKAVIAVNKSDLPVKLDIQKLREFSPYVAVISAKNDGGLEQLEKAVEEMFLDENFDPGADCYINERQKFCVEKSLAALKETLEGIRGGITPDCTAVSLEQAVGPLLDLTGERVSDTVVAQIFSDFCVGK